MLIADTDVLIDALRGVEPHRTCLAEALAAGSLVTTAISSFELLMGARRSRERAAVDTLLEAMPALPLDAAASRRASEVGRSLEAAGRAIGTCDTLIAGICLVHGGEILTRNRGHFERVDGLRIADPAPGR